MLPEQSESLSQSPSPSPQVNDEVQQSALLLFLHLFCGAVQQSLSLIAPFQNCLQLFSPQTSDPKNWGSLIHDCNTGLTELKPLQE